MFCKLKRFIGKYKFAAAGFLSGAANGLFGSGGGMIAVPMLEKSGVQPKKAHATSIALTAALSVVSGAVYLSHGGLDIYEALKYVPLGIVGAVVGTKLIKKIPDKNLHRIFGAVMIFAGIRILLKR